MLPTRLLFTHMLPTRCLLTRQYPREKVDQHLYEFKERISGIIIKRQIYLPKTKACSCESFALWPVVLFAGLVAATQDARRHCFAWRQPTHHNKMYKSYLCTWKDECKEILSFPPRWELNIVISVFGAQEAKYSVAARLGVRFLRRTRAPRRYGFRRRKLFRCLAAISDLRSYLLLSIMFAARMYPRKIH